MGCEVLINLVLVRIEHDICMGIYGVNTERDTGK